MSGYGWNPQRPDHRDRYFHLEERILTSPQLPAKIDLWPHVPAIWDQGQEGSCTAHGALRTLITEMIRQGLAVPSAAAGGAPLSRQAQYWWARSLEGSTGSDAGGRFALAWDWFDPFRGLASDLWLVQGVK